MAKARRSRSIFPLYESQAAADDEPEKEVLVGTGRILLVDDEPVIHRAMGRTLKLLGYEVESVYEGAEAVRAYRDALGSDRAFDVVITDLTIPGGMGAYGGNLDVKDLKAGTTVYLPVFHPGALFYTGDPHGAQGDGEVSGTAIEQSLSPVFRFVVHKGVNLAGPRAENDTHYLLMGIDLDLDRATRHATWEVVDFLVKEKGLTPEKALSLASIAVDFRVSEVVDLTQVVTGYIPKSIFLR